MSEPGTTVTTAEELAKKEGISGDEARRRLEAGVAAGELQREEQRTCIDNGHDLGGIDASICPECGSGVAVTILYVRQGQSPRLIPWFLVVHGMNTVGDWQEKLTWLIGRMYGRMVPVAIYKYGVIRPGVMFGWRQRQLMRKLQAKMRILSAEAAEAKLQGKPDVIAHSFGTWLIANALLDDETLVIGRLILLGAVVPPNFPWQTLLDRKQVEHVLNHGATKDAWVPLAHWGIPHSGPGGTRGFPPPIVNIRAEGFGHSDYFLSDDRLREVFDGVWRPFLSWSAPQFQQPVVQPRPWKPAWWILRKTTWLVAVLLFITILGVAAPIVGLLALLR